LLLAAVGILFIYFSKPTNNQQMSFDNVVGGKLKLKGLGDVKKDKKKRKRKEDAPEDAEEKEAKKQKLEDGTSSPPPSKPKKTAAELAYEEKQRERVSQYF
jgi:hypothetical protein